jgi:two-component system NtrC family response regulator
MSRNTVITTGDLPSGLSLSNENSVFDPDDFTDSYSNKVAAFETAMIDAALDLKNGNQSRAAELLGISERHLRSRMSKLNIVNTKKR